MSGSSGSERPPGLVVEGLEYTSEGFHLGPVDVRLAPGEVLCVFGPNGAGKSTLLRLLSGLEPVRQGRVWLDGAEITRRPPDERAVGFVFQDLALFPHLTVRDNIAYGPRAHRWPSAEVTDRVEEMLGDFHLSRLADRLPSRLSGGEQQRVALARALAPRPRLLLFDEPLSSADVQMRDRLLADVSARVLADRLVAVYVTHDLDEGLALAQRAAFLREGRWLREGPLEQVRGDPRSRFVAAFLGYNVVHENGHWFAADRTRTEIQPAGTGEGHVGTVQASRRDGEMVRVTVALEGTGTDEPALIWGARWGGQPPPRPGERVRVRFAERIPLSGE